MSNHRKKQQVVFLLSQEERARKRGRQEERKQEKENAQEKSCFDIETVVKRSCDVDMTVYRSVFKSSLAASL